MEVSAQHETFIEHFLTNGGNASQAAVSAGYDASTGYSLVRKLRERIQQRMEDELFIAQVQAIGVLKDSMGDGAMKPKQELRIRAAESTMDRGGLAKKQSIDLQGSELPAVMVLPAKDPAPASADT